MPAFQSVVEAISIKPLSEPDRYGNTFRASVKFGEDWYSWGSLKKQEINFKNGSGWHQLAKGDEIEGMYKQNGDFKNIQPKTVTLIAEGKGAPAPQAKPAAKTSGEPFINPSAIGNAGNYLMHCLEFTHSDMMDDEKILEGLVKYHESREQLYKFWIKAEGMTSSRGKKAEKPLTEKHKANVETPEYDDEV